MLADKSVRIIQRKHRELISVESKVVPPVKTGRQNEREMAQAVKSWIDELREGKSLADPTAPGAGQLREEPKI